MNIRSFNYPNFTSIFGSIESEKIGFYFSFCLHLIFLVFVIGFPDFFKSAPIYIPTVIPIEIVNVTETTSILKNIDDSKKQETKKVKLKQKKFNNIQPDQIKILEKPESIKKIQTKITSKTDIKKINITEEKKVEHNLKILTKIDDTIKDLQEENFESLPTKKIKPKIKPQQKNIENIVQDIDIKVKSKPSLDLAMSQNTNIKSKLKPSFDMQISSMLKDIRNDQTVINKEKIEKKLTQDKKKELTQDKIIKNENNESKDQLSISEIDLLIQQLSSCWIAPAGAVIKKGMVVKISAKIKPNKRVFQESVRIIDTNIPQSNSFYGVITESAMRTLLHPECNPLKLPADKYDLWKDLTLTFDYSIMKGYQ